MKTIAILIFTSILFSSCGPKRYKCGPYRRCQIEFKEPQKIIHYTPIC
ncbi:hypothetical protein FIA58_011560 [Flavobacterium jejuense]|uniref:Lipoprotein n=1 Tax=Flavobacterium jejuense TaxID=1544455 RepID=A0ABX0IRX0_9FLAO|nr:hypothetical protein [Flavobacterium jejuense]NHN26316.1 hypothetical protein [Flavobacterium jejuense]